MDMDRNTAVRKIVEKACEIEKGFLRLIEEGKISMEDGDRYNMMLFELDDMYIEYVNTYGESEALYSIVLRAAKINDKYLELIGIDKCVGNMY